MTTTSKKLNILEKVSELTCIRNTIKSSISACGNTLFSSEKVIVGNFINV